MFVTIHQMSPSIILTCCSCQHQFCFVMLHLCFGTSLQLNIVIFRLETQWLKPNFNESFQICFCSRGRTNRLPESRRPSWTFQMGILLFWYLLYFGSKGRHVTCMENQVYIHHIWHIQNRILYDHISKCNRCNLMYFTCRIQINPLFSFKSLHLDINIYWKRNSFSKLLSYYRLNIRFHMLHIP